MKPLALDWSIVRRLAPALGLFAIALLVLAGRPLARQELHLWAAAALLYGVLFWLLLGRYADEGEILEPLEPAGPAPRLLPLAITAALAILAWAHTTRNRFDTVGVVAWLGSVAAWVWAFAPRRSRIPDPHRAFDQVERDAPSAQARQAAAHRRVRPPLTSGVRPESRVTRGVVAALLLVMAVAAFLYFHRLAQTPGEPTSDHAETLLDVNDLLRGERPIFFVRNTGREPWKFYWLFVLVKVFGLPANFLTTKVGTVTTALLAIPAIFLMGRELGGSRLGLFAAALVAWSKWPLAMARLGIRVSYAVLPTAMVVWALLRYLRRGDRASALWAGAWIGIGLYGYIPFRIVPLLVLLVAALALIDPRWRGRRRRLLVDVPLIGVTAGLVFLPLLHYMREYPQIFWQRMAQRSSLANALSRETLTAFLDNLRNMALAFNVRGDGGWVNFVQRDPFLDVVTGGLFIAGIALALSRVFRGSVRWAVPLAALFVLTLPSVLILSFRHENPSVNRAVAAVPVVFLIAAAPLDRITGWLQPLRPATRIAGYAVLALLLALSVRESYRTYFFEYDQRYSRLVEHTQEMAQEIRAWEGRGIPRSNAYVLNAEYWLDPRNIGFELQDTGWAATNEVPPGKAPPLLATRPLLFVFRPSDETRRTALRRLYPNGEERAVPQSHSDRDFSTYVVR